LYLCTFCAFYVFKFVVFAFFVFFVFVFLYYFVLLCFLYFCTLSLGWTVHIWTSIQNLESVAQKMTELWVLMYFLRTFLHFLYFCILDYPYELPCKIWICSSKNDWVITLGTKEDTYVLLCLQVIIQSKPHFFIVQSLDNNCKIRVRSMRIGQFLSLQK